MTKQKRALLAASFLLPLLLGLLLYAVLGLAPFGGQSLVCSDADGQYISYFALYRDILLDGQDPFYSFGKVLGGSLAGLFAYYLASPLNLLLLLFPAQRLPAAMDLLILLKMSLCGLTMALYLDGQGRLRPLSLLFSTAYAFCGYNLAFGWCVMWLDAVLLLPLIALGLERLSRDGRPLLYLFALGLAIFACFYTGYMLCVFAVLYFLCCLANERPALRPTLLRFSAASLGAGGLSAAVLLPGILALQGGVSVSLLDNTKRFTYPAAFYLLERLLPGRDKLFYDSHIKVVLLVLIFLALLWTALALLALFAPRWKRSARALAGLLCLGMLLAWIFTAENFVKSDELLTNLDRVPLKAVIGVIDYHEMCLGSANVYVGLLVLLAALSYFWNARFSRQERRTDFLLLLVLLLSLLLYLPNLVWHGFERNNCFNYRYSFVVCFVLIRLAERSLSRWEGLRRRAVLIPAALLLASLVQVWFDRPYWVSAPMLLLSALWLLLSAGALLLARRREMTAALLAVQLIGLCFTAGMSYRNLSAHSRPVDEFAAGYTEYRARFAALQARDGDFYRIRKDKVLYNSNDPMLYRYRSILHFSSAEKVQTLRFLSSIGLHIDAQYWANGDDGASRAADLLLGVRYSLGQTHADVQPGEDGFARNPYALSLAFAAADAALTQPTADGDPCANLNEVFSLLCPGTEPLYVPAASDTEDEDRLHQTVTAVVETPELLYLAVSAPHLYTLSIQVNDGEAIERRGPYSPSALELGRFQPGDRLTLKLRYLEAVPTDADRPRLYAEQDEALAEVCARLSALPCAVELPRDSRIRVRATTTAESPVLLLSIPHDEGWTVTVDGQRAEPETALGVFLALRLSPGEHLVELRYVPPGLVPGLVISVCTLAAALLYAALDRRKRHGQG